MRTSTQVLLLIGFAVCLILEGHEVNACKEEGRCRHSNECCSGECRAHGMGVTKCAPGSRNNKQCIKDGIECTEHSDCCSQRCQKRAYWSKCIGNEPPSQQNCKKGGERCGQGHDCCSKKCRGVGMGVFKCDGGDYQACSQKGMECVSDADCCAPATCHNRNYGYSICR